ILSDEAYAGTFWYGKHHSVKDEITGKKRFLKTDPSQWVAVKVPAIVSRELWEAARCQAAQNEKNATRSAKYPFLLRRLMRCSCCNGGFFGSHHGKKPVYRCKGTFPEKWAEPTPRTCKGKVRADVVENLVWNTVKEMLKNPEMITAIIQEKQAEFKPK